ncbi:MAG: GNAT family N-acetyltransferase [Candidatus Thorarchaeota archaeon]
MRIIYSGKKIYLRALETNDLEIIMKGWNNWGIRRYLSNLFPNSKLSEENWLKNATLADPWKDGRIHFAIENKSHEFIGTCGYFNINIKDRRAELGIAIHSDDNLGKGYGTDALIVLLWVAFHIMNFHSIYLKVIDFNKRAIRAYEKTGFKKAGMYREAIFVEGSYHDLLTMDILRNEYNSRYPPGSYVHEK